MTTTPAVYRRSDDESVTETVVRAVADVQDVDPLQMDSRLGDAVDPGAIENLCDKASNGSDTSVSFVFAGHRVTVEASGFVFVTEQEPDHTNTAREERDQTMLRGSESSLHRVLQTL
ncbi:HalOD1 output domain-containing protein [Halovenus marina]|uniref:HalOD1 output domain-containing protein n=1 Tax=Halovenus marina TaxID=3396621 RepID=UPI003F553FF5